MEGEEWKALRVFCEVSDFTRGTSSAREKNVIVERDDVVTNRDDAVNGLAFGGDAL
jgi:hypothetical protein